MYLILVLSLIANVVLSFTAFIWRYFAKEYEKLADKLIRTVFNMSLDDYNKLFE